MSTFIIEHHLKYSNIQLDIVKLNDGEIVLIFKERNKVFPKVTVNCL